MRIEIKTKTVGKLNESERRAFFAVHQAYYSTTPAGFDRIHWENHRELLKANPDSLAHLVKVGGKLLGAALVLRIKEPTAEKPVNKRVPQRANRAAKNRWYSMAVDPLALEQLVPRPQYDEIKTKAARKAAEKKVRRERSILTASAMRELQKKVRQTTPKAWGTIGTQGKGAKGRINFFLKGWKIAQSEEEILKAFDGVHPPSEFAFRRRNGQLQFARQNSVHSITSSQDAESGSPVVIRNRPLKFWKLKQLKSKSKVLAEELPNPLYWQVLLLPRHTE